MLNIELKYFKISVKIVVALGYNFLDLTPNACHKNDTYWT